MFVLNLQFFFCFSFVYFESLKLLVYSLYFSSMEKKELSLSPNLSLSMAMRRLEDKAEKMARLRGEI